MFRDEQGWNKGRVGVGGRGERGGGGKRREKEGGKDRRKRKFSEIYQLNLQVK